MTSKHHHHHHHHSNIVFDDGQDSIDFVLVYLNDTGLSPRETSNLTEIRKSFIQVLKNHKIQIIEKKIIKTDKHEIGFTLLHLPWDVLINEAEKLKLKVPLKKLKQELRYDSNRSTSKKFGFLRYFHHKIPANQHHLGFHHETFVKEHAHKHMKLFKEPIHFRNSQRHYVMKEILDSISYKFRTNSSIMNTIRFRPWSRLPDPENTIRLTSLLNEGVYSAAFPLHEGNVVEVRYKHIFNNYHEKIDRKVLYEYWASWRCLLKFQPINEIEHYFGPKVAFYFAWIGFYTTWLFPMAILGVLFFFFGPLDPSYDEGNNFICGDEADNIQMCPLCRECSSWHLSDICSTAKLNKMFDNVFTIIFSSIINFWAIFCLEFWRRHSKQLAYLWGVLDYQQDEEKMSPYYSCHATDQRRNPITDKFEPYFPASIKFVRRLISFAILLFFIVAALFFHLVIIFLRLNLHHLMFMSEGLRPFASLTSNVFCGLLNLVFIIMIDHFYSKVAKVISKWEMYKTEKKCEESLIVKLFTLVSVNYYLHAFYIAFLKGKVSFTFDGVSYFETCSHTGCHIEVAFYLFITFGGKQMLKSAFDIAYPRIKRFSNIIKSGLPNANYQWEKDYQLNDIKDLVDIYLYLVLQFGFVTLFAAAFPLGPFFAFVFNLLSIRINAQKLLCESRRMVTKRADGIGIWFKILTTLTNLSVLSNALIIAFSSDALDKLIYYIENRTIDGFTNKNLFNSTLTNSNETCRYFETKYHGDINTETYLHYHIIAYKLIFVIVYQNIASWVQKYIEISIPDIPTNLHIRIQKEQYLTQKLIEV